MNTANRALFTFLLREGSRRSSLLIRPLAFCLALAIVVTFGAAQVAPAAGSADAWAGSTSGLFNAANWMVPATFNISGITFNSGAAAFGNPNTAGKNCLSLTGNVADITGNDLLTIGADVIPVNAGHDADALSLNLALCLEQPWTDGSASTMTANSATPAGDDSLILPGADSRFGTTLYAGATNLNSGGLDLTTGVTTSLNGTSSIAGGTVSQTAATVSQPSAAGGPNQQPTILTIGGLPLSNSPGVATSPGGVGTGGNSVPIVPPAEPIINQINLTNGATFDAGQGTGMYGFNAGGGTITVSGTATISGNLQASFSDTDPVQAIGIGSGATINYTGTLRGSVSYFNLSVNFVNGGSDHEGYSPHFTSVTGGTFNFATNSSGTSIAVNNPTPYSPVIPPSSSNPTISGSGGGYTQYLIAGYVHNSVTTAGTGAIASGVTFAWDSSGTFNPATAYSSEAFYIVNTDGHMWPNANITSGLPPVRGTYQYVDGTLTGFNNITISSFTGLPTLPSGYQWDVESTSEYIKLYIGVTSVGTNGVAEGTGVWENGAADQKWTTNSSPTNNWGGGQPSSAGEIATFDNTVIHYAGGVVNVDEGQTIGGISLSDSGQGGYTISGSAITLNNVTNDGLGDLTPIDPTIVVNSGTHTIAAPLVIESGTASGGVNGLAVTVDPGAMLTISGVISSGYNSGNNVALFGGGTLVLSGANTYTGSTTVSNSELVLAFGAVSTNILPSTSALILDNGALTLTGTGTQTLNGLTTTANTGNQITLAANETLTLGALTSVGAGSALNFNTAAGGANGATVGNGVVVLTGQTAGSVINPGFTVSDSTGFGLATVNGSNDVIRLLATNLLPASGAVSNTNYTVDNNNTNFPSTSQPGSFNLVVSASESARSITVDTTARSGVLTLNSGVVLRNDTWNFGGGLFSTNTYQITGGTLQAVNSGDRIQLDNYNNGAVTISSTIADNGGNPSAVSLSGNGTTVLAGANTFSGGTTLNGSLLGQGTLQVGISSTTSGSGTGMTITNGATGTGLLTIKGGTVDLNGFNLAVAGLSGNDRGTIASSSTSAPSSLTIVTNRSGGPQTYSGVIADTTGSGNQTVSVEVDGTGTQTLNGRNTYSGATTVNSGTLEIGRNGSISNTSQVTVNGGTLLFSGNNNINSSSANVTLNGGTIAMGSSGNSQTVGTLTLSGTSTIDYSTFNNTLRFANSSSLATSWTGSTLNILSWTPADALYFGNSSGGLTAGQLSQIDFAGYAPGAQISSTGLVTPIPEPSSVLVGLSLLSLAAYRERHRFLRGRQARGARIA